MSSPANTFRLFYPDSNTITAASFFDLSGTALVPTTMVDGPQVNGLKSKDVSFASLVEPLFVNPTFVDAANPVPVYLTRNDSGVVRTVIDESLFNQTAPGRPTVAITALQENLLYIASDLGDGFKSYAVKTPESAVCIVKDAGKDPITGAALDGNHILFRWSGPVPTALEVEADVEDIADPAGFLPIGITNITTYAESSVGLSMVKSDSQIVPRDGMGHAVNFRIRYTVGGDVGAWVALNNHFITFKLIMPHPPVSLTVQLLRDRMDTISDVVKVDWVKDAVSPGTGVEIVATDFLGKKHTLYTSNGSETRCRIENVSRFIVQDTGPAVARPYVFAIIATNLSGKSSETQATAALNITSKLKPVTPPTPDEIAGTARTVAYAGLKAEVFADVLAAMGTLPADGQTLIYNAIDKAVLKIKDVVSKGGHVTLDNFGVIEAKWTADRMARNPATGAPVVVPAYRGVSFVTSMGFKTGTKQGKVMTDLQAKPSTATVV
jgi:nucleoid DNA-binding protein